MSAAAPSPSGRPVFEVEYGCDGPVLESYLHSWARVNCIKGPLGSGKTNVSIQKAQLVMERQAPNAQRCRRTRIYVVRNTYRELMSTTIKDFEEWIDDRFYRFPKSGQDVPTATLEYDLEDGTWVWNEMVFLALDRGLEAIRRLRGSQATAFWLNEMKELSFDVVIMALGRLPRFPRQSEGGATWSGIFGDYNAPDDDHYIAKLEKKPPEGWRFFVQPGGVTKGGLNPDGTVKWVANPAAENLRFLAPTYYTDQVGIARSLPAADQWISVNLANINGLVLDGKPVHPIYNDAVHTVAEGIPFDPEKPIYLGLDYGRTPACVIAQEDEQMGRLLAIGEFVAEDMSAALFGPQLRDHLARHYRGARVRGWGDPAGDAKGQATEDTPRDIIRAAGIPVDSAPSNVFALRTGALDKLLATNAMDGRPRFLLSGPGCPRLRRALMGGYRFRRLKVIGEEAFMDAPEKDHHSHIAEATHYLALGMGAGREILRKAPARGGAMRRGRAILR